MSMEPGPTRWMKGDDIGHRATTGLQQRNKQLQYTDAWLLDCDAKWKKKKTKWNKWLRCAKEWHPISVTTCLPLVIGSLYKIINTFKTYEWNLQRFRARSLFKDSFDTFCHHFISLKSASSSEKASINIVLTVLWWYPCMSHPHRCSTQGKHAETTVATAAEIFDLSTITCLVEQNTDEGIGKVQFWKINGKHALKY